MKAAVILLAVAMACAAPGWAATDNLVNNGRIPQSLMLSRLMQDTVENSNADAQCPPAGFDSVKNFDLERYISAPWYVQKQIPTTFQPENTLFCVRAEYTPIVDSSNNLKAINVRNYSNRDKVNGPAVGTSGAGGSFPGRFIANIPNAEDPSKLNVGFALGESNTPLIGAPYWVVAIDEENYEWAIITGGAPAQESGDGKCITDGGFWFFTRKPVDPESTAKMLEVAEGLGLDTAKLVNVPQEGCLYEGA